MAACPAGIDIPGILRRWRPGNLLGAAACGARCTAGRRVRRLSRPGAVRVGAATATTYAGAPVRIAELLRVVRESTANHV